MSNSRFRHNSLGFASRRSDDDQGGDGTRAARPVEENQEGDSTCSWSRNHGKGRGGRGYGRGRGRGRGGGGSGPPEGLRGRDIGMWYAARGRARKEANQVRNRPAVGMKPQQEKHIRSLLDDVRDSPTNEGAIEIVPKSNPRDEQFRSFYQHSLTPQPVLDRQLHADRERKQSGNQRYREMQTQRERLPSYKMRNELVELIGRSQVVVISGETGCGKTTQVPQFILDHHIEKGQGSSCRVICTQPRRISAVTVAERVASERAEPCGNGNSTGYQIRLEARLPRQQGCILYCTNGILLKWLESDPLLNSVSHVVLDEVHERDIISDFLLVILRDVLPKRPTLRLILMSATLNANQFSEYFGGCPMTNIPGFAYPVMEYWLEDILQMTKYQPPDQRASHREPMWLKFRRGKRYREDELKEEAEFKERFKEYITEMRKTYTEEVVNHLERMNHEEMDLDLAASLIRHICLNKPEGALLVFLPGWEQISKLNDILLRQQMFKSSNFVIIPLHSMMPTCNQRQVFDRPPPGVRKIIIATNIAETSITIEDIVYVVNVGRVKERNFDVANNLSTLKPEWVSKASAHQRRGRAGRVQPGECYHLYNQLKSSMLADYQLPEMLRTPLDEICLQIKSLKLGKVRDFISKTLQQPDPRAVDLALKSLLAMNALDDNEDLTPLGYHLARLPVSPAIGRMILFGAMFCCLDPILTIAASLSFKDPFIIPLGKERLADARRKLISKGTFSDHLMLVNAFSGWEEAKDRGRHAESDYCWTNFMTVTTLKMLDNMKTQFCELLASIGFVEEKSCKHHAANKNSGNHQLIKAVLCSGLYPNVAQASSHSTGRKAGSRPAKITTPQDGRVKIHPKSVNSDESRFPTNWILYHLKLKSSCVFLHDTSAVEPYPLLFFGGKIGVQHENGVDVITVDNHIKFSAPATVAHLVKDLRQELDKVLRQKISQPGATQWDGGSHEGRIMKAISDLITTEDHHGMGTAGNDDVC